MKIIIRNNLLSLKRKCVCCWFKVIYIFKVRGKFIKEQKKMQVPSVTHIMVSFMFFLKFSFSNSMYNTSFFKIRRLIRLLLKFFIKNMLLLIFPYEWVKIYIIICCHDWILPSYKGILVYWFYPQLWVLFVFLILNNAKIKPC